MHRDSEGKEGLQVPQTVGVGKVQYGGPRRAGHPSPRLAVLLAAPVLWLFDQSGWVHTAQPALLIFPTGLKLRSSLPEGLLKEADP